MDLSRRSFIKGAAIGIVGAASAGILSSCTQTNGDAAASAASSSANPSSAPQTEGAAAAASEEEWTVGSVLNPQDTSFTRYTTDYSHIFSPLKIGDVTVSIQVEDGKIVKAIVDTSNETADIGRGLGDQFASQILEKGSVDAVSQATVTSNAVSTALNDCLRQAGLLP